MESIVERETWRAIPGWEGFYEASDQGRVRSLDRWSIGQRRRFWRGVVLQPRRGLRYLFVTLHRPGMQRQAEIHRLVLEAFAGPCPAGREVAHGNGDPHDNRLANLRYDTRMGNNADKRRHGTHLEGERTPAAKLTAEQAQAIYQRRGEGRQTALALAAEHGCCEANVYAIWSRKSWRSVNS